MPLTVTIEDEDLVADASEALFKVSLKIAQHQHELHQKILGKQIEPVAKWRGVITSISNASVSVKREDGQEKVFPLSGKKLKRQLVQETTRK